MARDLYRDPGSMDIDFSWITSHLAIGAKVPEGSVRDLCGHGFSRVIDLRHEERDDEALFQACGLELLCLPTLDFQAISQEMLWEGVEWAREGLAGGLKLLIHCQHGIGRSALLACCTLVASYGLGPAEALHLAKKGRSKVSPSPAQLHAYLQWVSDWNRSRSLPPPDATWDHLAQIAYGHARLR